MPEISKTRPSGFGRAASSTRIIRFIKPPLALALMMAASLANAATSDRSITLCSEAGDAMRKDPALRAASTAALGASVRIQTDGDSEACTTLAALLAFDDTRVLVAAVSDRGGADAGDTAHLSAYFLRNEGGSLRLVDTKLRFADSAASWGRAGDIGPAHFGQNNGMIISADQSSEGYSTTTADLFVFRSGQIVRLGTIPTDWGNGGAAGSKSKEISVHSKVETGLQGDRVRVIYTRTSGQHGSTMTSIWRSEAGHFVLEAGKVPADIIKAFALPANIVARNGTPVPAGDAGSTSQAGEGGSWTIADSGLSTPPPAILDTIKHDPAYPPVCKLVGREMIPSVSTSLRSWFVATANKCDWGADLGPTWLVTQPAAGPATIVLSVIGHRVTLDPSVHDGFHDIVLSDKTQKAAGAHYGFDGKSYRKQGL
ncbi:hypothetical protein [Bradyrhizobium sp. SK17]|uniref:hypothetical protein n=1 Tax=Bradyrhizobium sp. SK17 TaxID=2057741 RepID=UPI0012FDE8AF|nr:hypothetical protein [Bradyrhizobium sp. SK17]